MVPMHLGRIDWPFVPRNLISAQESSRWPPDLILMSSGSKKGTQIYYPFLSRSPGKRIYLHFPQCGPYGDRCPLTEHFYISLDISLYLKGPKKRAAPMETDAHSRALLNISFRVPSKGALPPGPPHRVPLERVALFLEPSFIHHSKSLVYEPPLLIPGSPQT